MGVHVSETLKSPVGASWLIETTLAELLPIATAAPLLRVPTRCGSKVTLSGTESVRAGSVDMPVPISRTDTTGSGALVSMRNKPSSGAAEAGRNTTPIPPHPPRGQPFLQGPPQDP